MTEIEHEYMKKKCDRKKGNGFYRKDILDIQGLIVNENGIVFL